ncbi:MAG: hydroxymethylglutaryl-CoA synthase [Candidatus Caldarchaeales archaeon]
MARIRDVAILGYGGYVPRLRIRATEIARVWGREEDALPVREKSVNELDEDAITMAIEAARYAMRRAGIDPSEIGAVNVGSESHPYAVKPSGTVVAEALGIPPNHLAADLEFACKAGTEALQMISGLVSAGIIRAGLAIGADTAQGRPGDALEFTAAAGAAAFVVGRQGNGEVATIEHARSYVTDTPDFWRRAHERYPSHTFRFTGEPAYFHHTLSAVKGLLEEAGLKVSDVDYFVFHQPNYKFPFAAAKVLGIPKEKVEPGVVTHLIGNTYAASSMMGLVKVLDAARPGQRIVLTSFGSGAGSDSFLIETKDGLLERRPRAPLLETLINRAKYVDYATYLRHRDKIRGA